MAIIDIKLTIAIDKSNQTWYDVLFKIADDLRWRTGSLKEETKMEEMIVRRVKVDRSRAPQAVLDAASRRQYPVYPLVTCPGGGFRTEVVDVHFFNNPDRSMSDEELEKEYERRGLVAADPYSLAAVNEADAAFADQYPNGTHWKDAEGRWWFVMFHRLFGDARDVYVGHHGGDKRWGGHWWFAGVVRK